ncbi:MAG: hypothetical protein ABJO09_01645 [Hyphomicrobiales bacterium]
MSEKRIIAMWSGPRNLSTAMMRSFENRADTQVWDEPFYAAYLADTGLAHPMTKEVIAAGDQSWKGVAHACQTAAINVPIFYQKHMTHHMLPDYDRAWIADITNAFLIRDPERVVASYGQKHNDVSLADIGFTQQVELFDLVCEQTGKAPPVIDATDVRQNPKAALSGLCNSLDIPFVDSMLSWPAGRRETDGVWAAHWYDSVVKSTGFAPPDTKAAVLTDAQKRIVEAARPIYEHMKLHALQVD